MDSSNGGMRKGTATAERIISAAVELFYEQGFPTTTVREITAACGITPGALYNHFSSKEELLYSIQKRLHDSFEALVAEVMAWVGDDPVAQLREATRVVTLLHTVQRMESLVGRAELRRLPPQQANEMFESERRIRRTWEAIIRRGLERGVFVLQCGGQPADVGVVAKSLLDSLTQVASWYRPHGPLSAQKVADLYAVLALQTVGVPPEIAGEPVDPPTGSLAEALANSAH